MRVLSNSWGGGGFSQALLDQINRADAADMLFVASAGNSGSNNDPVPTYPAQLHRAERRLGGGDGQRRRSWRRSRTIGASSVHLGAPGVDIAVDGARDGGYVYGSGTSMAAPHVSGAAALVLAACNLNTAELKAVLLDHVGAVPALGERTMTGGRLDVGSALLACTSAAPPPDFSIAATPASVTVKRGGTAAYTVSVTGQPAYSSTVALRVSGYPTGATATFTPASVTGSGSSRLAVKAGTTRGTFTLTLTAADPIREHATTVKLQVK